jgi:glycosyltransferase involved in cell wall biosynthesis
VRYLLAHYSVRTIMIAGCEFVYHLLPAIRRDFPAVRIVDQLFNDEVHLPNNRHYAQHIEMTVVPSQSFAETLFKKYGESPERVSVILHGVSSRGPQFHDHAAALAVSGLPAEGRGKFLVSFFGRFSEEKGPDVFVEIARRLKDSPEIYFCMTGEGPARPTVLNLIRRYKLQRKIYAPGFVDNFRTLMELSDVIVVPSRSDGMPLVVLEAQALGKPVVASATGSIPEMIRDNESGFLCEPGNVTAFCQRILELFRSPQKRSAIGAAAQEAVRRRHNIDTMIAAYLEVFQRIHEFNS